MSYWLATSITSIHGFELFDRRRAYATPCGPKTSGEYSSRHTHRAETAHFVGVHLAAGVS